MQAQPGLAQLGPGRPALIVGAIDFLWKQTFLEFITPVIF